LEGLDEVRRFFAADRFATQATGIEIVEATSEEVLVRLEVGPQHMNAAGYVMGGVLFTMADFAFAIASNMGQRPTVTLSSTIQYVSATRGPVLHARTERIRQGHAVRFFRVTITDDDDRTIAVVETSGYRPGE